ncbi:MAG: DUF6359 domain-containing protein [Candidatus Egerieousia sp.]
MKRERIGIAFELKAGCKSVASLFALSLVWGMLLGFASCVKMTDEPDRPDDESDGKSSLKLTLNKESLGQAAVIIDSSFVYYDSGQRKENDLYPEGSIKGALDTNKYLLRITNSSGVDIYHGKYTERPSELYVRPGTYKVGIESREFYEPESLYPLFGQVQTVKCKKDSTVHISLKSSQLTGGMRFVFTKRFMEYFKGTGIYLKRDTIESKYRYTDSRYMFFREGKILVIYKNKDGHPSYSPPDRPGYTDTLLFYRKLQPEELVTITLDYDLTKVQSGGIEIKVDTARVRTTDYYNVGGIAPFGCQSILEAQKSIGDTITVFGYIVGGDATSTSFNRKKPFKSKTHILIASQTWQSLREKTLAVELPETDKTRQLLNLVDHPELLKRPIVIRGRVVDAYFGHPGLKYVKFYMLL